MQTDTTRVKHDRLGSGNTCFSLQCTAAVLCEQNALTTIAN